MIEPVLEIKGHQVQEYYYLTALGQEEESICKVPTNHGTRVGGLRGAGDY